MNKDYKNSGYGCFVMLVSSVAIILSFVSLLMQDAWKDKLTSQTFIVAILSVLITFLVAWQIWQTIDAKNIIKEIREDALRMQAQSKLDVQNARLMSMALLTTHEGETAKASGNFADAYMKYFTSLALFMMIKDPEDAIRIENNLNLVEKLLNDNVTNKNEAFLTRLKEVEVDIDKIYDTLIIFSEKVPLPQDLITRIKELHKRRKEYSERP